MNNRRYMVWGLGLALAGAVSCVDLDEQLVGSVTTKYYSTPAGLEAAVNGAYQQLQGVFGREQFMALSEMGTDLWTLGDQTSYRYMGTYDAGLNPSVGEVSFPWNGLYQGINTSNAIIDRAPAVVGMDPSVKAIRVAEARFLRALRYFTLVQLWGDVYLTLHESQGVSTDAHRTPSDSVYDAIIDDLDSALKYLPPVQSQAGRATRWAAMHLLSKVYLTRAYKPYAVAGDFQRAALYADSVIFNSGRALLPNYAALFCANSAADPGGSCDVTGLDENNSEVLFSVQYTTNTTQYTVGSGNYLHLVYLSFYDNLQGMQRDCNNGRAFRRLRPTLFARSLWQRWTDTVSGSPTAYTSVLDTRYDGSFQSVWRANWSNTGACFQGVGAARGNGYSAATCPSGGFPTFGTNCTNGAAMVMGDTAYWQPGRILDGLATCTPSGCSQTWRQSHRYAVLEPCLTEPCPTQTTVGQYDTFRYPTLKKYQDNGRTSYNEQDGGKDLVLMRLGETYLLAAEAYLGAGDAVTALDRINTLRERARNKNAIAPYNAPGSMNVSAVTIDTILNERGRELLGEQMRRFDLARTGLWNRITDRGAACNAGLAPCNLQATSFTLPKHALYPIPQSQIDLTTGGSAAFPQNPGY